MLFQHQRLLEDVAGVDADLTKGIGDVGNVLGWPRLPPDGIIVEYQEQPDVWVFARAALPSPASSRG
jgi:hypothetical protein